MKKTVIIMILAALACMFSSCGKKPISADYVKLIPISKFLQTEFW